MAKKTGAAAKGTPSAAAQLTAFLAKFSPEVRRQAKTALAIMRARLPGAVEMIYDNYAALVIGFGPNERPSDALFSLAVYPDHITLCFLQGAILEDPAGILQGSGNQVRHVRLTPFDGALDRAELRALMEQAMTASDVPWNPKQPRMMVIRLISKKQRPRRRA